MNKQYTTMNNDTRENKKKIRRDKVKKKQESSKQYAYANRERHATHWFKTEN